jgi:small nuclear ribonucleoprotein (snRNP)-like protein
MAGIRGHCLAFVAAFDKLWNLALEDVEEVWTRKIKRKTPALGGYQES